MGKNDDISGIGCLLNIVSVIAAATTGMWLCERYGITDPVLWVLAVIASVLGLTFVWLLALYIFAAAFTFTVLLPLRWARSMGRPAPGWESVIDDD